MIGKMMIGKMMIGKMMIGKINNFLKIKTKEIEQCVV